MPNQADSLDSLIGLEFSHYRIIEEIGSGGMGVVFRAHDQHLDREVAIKVLHPGTITDEGARKHLHKEALALSKLNHPNIATIFDFDTQRGMDFLVMEYIPGVTFNDKIAGGPLPENEVLRLGLQLSEGLAAAHEHGVVHRDLKPGNLRLTADGRLKILDFGLAKLRQPAAETVATESSLQTHSISGTLTYMAPEQLLGEEVDARTDIHAAGFVLYEMATGQRPFAEVERGQLIGALLRRPPTPPTMLNHKVSPELERIIGKCLEKEPENRYQSAKELAVDLHRLGRRMHSEYIPEGTHATDGWAFARLSSRARLGIATFLTVLVVAGVLVARKVGTWREGSFGSVPRIHSLAVLPLVNLSGDPEREYFADGMTEELITQLGKATPLRVISRQSVMQFKGTKMPLEEIAQKLKVDAVVEGSVLQSGNRVRVTARLVDAAADKPVWTEEYERDLRDVLTLQEEVTRAIVDEIKVKLTAKVQARLTTPRPVNPMAYEAYLKGRFQWYRLSKEGLDNAERYFQLALDQDPNYALAYSGMADVWLARGDSGFLTARETVPKAKAFASKALELDDTLADAHVSLANIETTYEWDWAAAEREFQRAIQLNPSHANAHFMYADFLISQRHNHEWQVEIQRTLELDPMNFFYQCFYGWHLVYVGRYDEAISQLQKVLATQPNFSSAHMGLWGAFYKKGMEEEAVQEAEKFFGALGDREIVQALEKGYREASYRRAMKRAADALAARAERTHVPSVRIARVYAHAGENDRTVYWLEKAYAAKETPLVHLSVARDWDALRADPRFQDLLHRMNLPQ
jgi:eukaryotic-like serine/threonine-protein kinase